jgi:hypothetical protein
MLRVPELYSPKWYKPRMSKLSFILNLLVAILESCIIVALCYLFCPYYVVTDVGMNMVCSLFSFYNRQ